MEHNCHFLKNEQSAQKRIKRINAHKTHIATGIFKTMLILAHQSAENPRFFYSQTLDTVRFRNSNNRCFTGV